MALGVLKKDGWTDPIGPGTRLEVQVQEPTVKHTVTLMQVERWVNGATLSPNEKVKRERLRGMLNR